MRDEKGSSKLDESTSYCGGIYLPCQWFRSSPVCLPSTRKSNFDSGITVNYDSGGRYLIRYYP